MQFEQSGVEIVAGERGVREAREQEERHVLKGKEKSPSCCNGSDQLFRDRVQRIQQLVAVERERLSRLYFVIRESSSGKKEEANQPLTHSLPSPSRRITHSSNFSEPSKNARNSGIDREINASRSSSEHGSMPHAQRQRRSIAHRPIALEIM
jgi:hypothetical protein